ncbi:MAG: pyruvate kinase [Omnitrophica bacterium GWA2_52_12]|nr:MAG: pyruvate kinase [Omnitrophica bacterium GWA2_52_12]
MRRTKIVATVGPACEEPAKLEALILSGVDILRINASHTTPEGLAMWIRKVRKAAAHVDKTVAVMVDLQGPRLRTGKLPEGKPVGLRSGEKITIMAGVNFGSKEFLSTPCREFPLMVKRGDRVLLDNGLMELRVLEVSGKKIACRVVMGGLLSENKGINLPNAPVTLPALTAKDRADLAVAAKLDVDYIALSFVRTEKDVAALKDWLRKNKKDIPVIAKIEKPGALERIDAILQLADAIMVARGDLGIELGVEKVPAIQKSLIEKANQYGVPVITATQMLETMIERATPTRAEVSDVANAVFDGTDAVMLSGETAVGDYALNVVGVMANILEEAEKSLPGTLDTLHLPAHGADYEEFALYSVTRAACLAQGDLHARGIMVFSLSGKTARLVSKFKPYAPVFVFCQAEKICRRLNLLRGVFPLMMRYGRSTDAMLELSEQVLLKNHLLKKGDTVVMVSGRQALPGSRYMLTIHRLGEKN